MTTDEPISVRVARAKGCSDHRLALIGEGDYLAPAASFALLSEMVDAGRSVSDLEKWATAGASTYYIAFERRSGGLGFSGHGPTLAEAIALAWLMWKEPAEA